MSDRPVTIVVLAKFNEVFKGFLTSCDTYVPSQIPKILVQDGNEIDNPQGNWTVIQGPDKFSMAGNANLGLKAVPDTHDILYCGDDVRFLESSTIERLQKIAYSRPEIGILSPKIKGRGSATQVNPKSTVTYTRPLDMWFPCIYIKRELINKIGYLDERFNDFGSDDLDFCIRTRQAGYKLAITKDVCVEHEASPEGGPTTFVKKLGVEKWREQEQAALSKICEKYDISWATLSRFLDSGDISLLEHKQCAPVQPDQAEEYLKGRSLYIATPAYGGVLYVNYVNSLIGLMNLCHNLGITYTIAFKYNESLITRARNSMAHDYLKGCDFTDFVFIDADIGFDPKQILTLLLYKEPVISVPCVRKSVNWGRILSVVKNNGHREYTPEELNKLGGEFVINFEGESAPSSINLGELIEVQDAGTGIMRIRRETFTNVMDSFPERWYLPMGGEGAPDPHYLFFQSEIDPNPKENTTPHYLSEDYSFCRLVRKAGMKVYIAPWITSSHFGNYAFLGDMPTVGMLGGGLR